MIGRLGFYACEATLITLMSWAGLWCVVDALQRMGVAVKLRLVVPLMFWLVLFVIDTVMSELLGPEFTLHYYFGIWALIGGAGMWLITLLRLKAAALRARRAPRTPAVAEER